MLIFNYLKQFWRDMTSQKLRTAMTVFGIVWGTVAVTLLLAFGEGMHHQLKVSQLGLGENIVICWPAQTSKPWQGLPRGRRIRLTDEDIEVVRREVPEIKAISSEYSNTDNPLTVGRKVLVPGNQASQNTKIPDRMTALAYSGMEVVKIEMNEMTRSRTEPSFIPASTPSTRDRNTMMVNVMPARIAVLPSRDQKMSLTGFL